VHHYIDFLLSMHVLLLTANTWEIDRVVHCAVRTFSAGTGIYCSQIPAGTGISTSVDQGLYPRLVAVLVYESDMPGHLY